MGDSLTSLTLEAPPNPAHRVGVCSKPHLVGVTGFEPATSSSRTTRATKLRHTPWLRTIHLMVSAREEQYYPSWLLTAS